MKAPAVVPLATRRRSSCYNRAVVDPHVEYVQDLGLFLWQRAFKGERIRNDDDAEVAQAIERMLRDRTEPPVWVWQALLCMGDIGARFVKSCSAAELCVLLHTLKWLKEQPKTVKLAPLKGGQVASALDAVDHAIAATSDAVVVDAVDKAAPSIYYAQLHDAVTTAVRKANESDGRDELLLAFHGDAETLRVDVVAALVTERHNQHIATLLQDMSQSTGGLLGSLSQLSADELQRMARTGCCVSLRVVQELASANGQAVLVKCFKQTHASKLYALSIELSRAATASLSTELLALWTALQSAISASGVVSIGRHGSHFVNAAPIEENGATLSDVAIEVTSVPQRQNDFYAHTSRAAQNLTRALDAKQRETKKLGDLRDARRSLKMVDAAFEAAAQGNTNADASTKGWWQWLTSKLPSLSKMEIMRDFAQTISLVFTNLYSAALAAAPDKLSTLQRRLEQIQIFYRGLSNAAAADFTAVLLRYYDGDSDFASDVLFGLLIAVIAVAFVCFLGLVTLVGLGLDRADSNQSQLLHTDNQRVAEQVRRKQRRFIQIVTVVLTICQSVHLPVARLGMEILTSSPETNAVRRRYERQWFWTYLYHGALISLPLYVGGLILLLFFLIHFNAPKVTQKKPLPGDQALKSWSPCSMWKRLSSGRKNLMITNLTGDHVEFHNSVYAELIKRDPEQLRCPYRSLYGGFEHHWRFYKVWQLTIKVVLTMLLIWLQNDKGRALSTVVVTFLSFLSTWSAPFIDDFDDWMEFSAKGTSFITCLGGVMLAYRPQNDSAFATFVSLLVSGANILNTLFMAAITMFGTDSVLVQIRNWRGRLTFSNSQWYAVNMPPEKVLPKWDVEYEIRHRVWHAFWKKLLLSLQQDAAIQRLANVKDSPDKLVVGKKRNTTAGRLEAHKLMQQQQHWQGQADERIAAMRLILRSVLEGPDVYYEAPGDGLVTEHSAGFGRLTVVPYPFHCVFQFEQARALGKDHVLPLEIVDDNDIAALFFTNFRCDIVRKRELRLELRALSAWAEKGGTVELRFEREEQWVRPQTSHTQEDGLSKTQENVSFDCRYRHGAVSVQCNSDDGFDDFCLSIRFRDGSGDVVCTDTGQLLQHATNRSCVIKGPTAFALLGLSEAFEDSEAWRQIIQQPPVAQALVDFVPQIRERQRAGCQQRIVEQNEFDQVLSSGFRFVVYNNPHISRHTLEKYLAEEERNETLRRVPSTHRAALDLLYERLHFIYSDPRVAFWFLFWHDVYEQNGHEIQQLEAYRVQFDPEESTAICYEPKSREDLQRWLQRRSLWGERVVPGTQLRWRKNLFYKELLDLVYEGLEQQVVTSH